MAGQQRVEVERPKRSWSAILAVLVIFAVGAVPLAAVVHAWSSGHRTDISLALPGACGILDPAVIEQLAAGGVATPTRTQGDTSASDRCDVDTVGADVSLALGAEPTQYDAAWRTSRCGEIEARVVTSGRTISCERTATEAGQARIDAYVWVDGVYEVHFAYQRIPPVELAGPLTATADRVVRQAVDALPTRHP